MKTSGSPSSNSVCGTCVQGRRSDMNGYSDDNDDDACDNLPPQEQQQI
jgi:hypothetical protein